MGATDIVERLRAFDPEKQYETSVEMECLCQDAADDIERLKLNVEQLISDNDRLRGLNAELVETLQAIAVEGKWNESNPNAVRTIQEMARYAIKRATEE